MSDAKLFFRLTSESRIVVYSITDLALRYENYITTRVPGCIPSRNVSIDSIQLIQLLSAYGVVTLSGIDKMNEHLKLMGYKVVLLYLQPIPIFYREVERTALICDHF